MLNYIELYTHGNADYVDGSGVSEQSEQVTLTKMHEKKNVNNPSPSLRVPQELPPESVRPVSV